MKSRGHQVQSAAAQGESAAGCTEGSEQVVRRVLGVSPEMRGVGRHAAHPDADAGWGAAREVDQDAQGRQGPVGDRAQSTAAGGCAVRVVAQADDQTGGLGGSGGRWTRRARRWVRM